MHAGVDHQLHVDHVVGGRGECVDELWPVDARSDRPTADLGGIGDRRFRQQQDGRIDSGLPESGCFLDECDRQPGSARLERRFGHGYVTVAVCVGLDDGDHLCRCCFSGEGRDVVSDGTEVDLDPRGPHAVTCA